MSDVKVAHRYRVADPQASQDSVATPPLGDEVIVLEGPDGDGDLLVLEVVRAEHLGCYILPEGLAPLGHDGEPDAPGDDYVKVADLIAVFRAGGGDDDIIESLENAVTIAQFYSKLKEAAGAAVGVFR